MSVACICITIFIYIPAQKLQERSSTFEKAELSPKAKEKWKKVLQSDLMSSEESSSESDDVFVKPLPWRAEIVNKFFTELDAKVMEKKTSQASRQRKPRKLSVSASIRSIPHGVPKWAIKQAM